MCLITDVRVGGLFDRVPSSLRPILEHALCLLPRKVSATIAPRFLFGIDPVWAGLHAFDDNFSFDGMTWRRADCAHACYSYLVADGKQTVVFPDVSAYSDPIGTVIHEIGHLYDEATGFSDVHVPVTTAYSRVDRYERFAEAFEIVLRPESETWRARGESEAFRPFRELIGAGA